MRLTPSRLRSRAAWTVAMSGVAAASLVSAQPAQAPQAQPANPTPAPGPPVTEEAPPINVPPPAPLVVPPISEREVAPAPPPKAQVAETPIDTPVRRERYGVAILQALDKVTAESLRFEVQVGGKPVRYKNLIFTVRACERSAPDEPIEDSIAYLTVDSQPRPERGKPTPPARQAFRGWMYASSPGLNPLQHPGYDAWLISCRTVAPSTNAAAPGRPVAAAAPPVKAAASPSPAPAAKAAPAAATPAPKVLPPPVPKSASPAPAPVPAPKAATPAPKAASPPPAAPAEEPIT